VPPYVPRRLDIHSRNPQERAACARVRVFLDDHEVTGDCCAADEEAGLVLLLLRDEEGHRYLVETDDGAVEIARAWIPGKVEIAWRDA
jgi:hypothetical protein